MTRRTLTQQYPLCVIAIAANCLVHNGFDMVLDVEEQEYNVSYLTAVGSYMVSYSLGTIIYILIEKKSKPHVDDYCAGIFLKGNYSQKRAKLLDNPFL